MKTTRIVLFLMVLSICGVRMCSRTTIARDDNRNTFLSGYRGRSLLGEPLWDRQGRERQRHQNK